MYHHTHQTPKVPYVAIQVVLSSADMPTGNAIAIFFNSLGGAIAISIAQNIFSNGLTTNLAKDAPDVNYLTIITAGATKLRQVVTAAQLPGVLQAYMTALQQAYVMSIAVAGIAVILSCFVEWKNVKGQKIELGAAA